MTEQVTLYDFSPSPSVGPGACGRAPTHPEEIDYLKAVSEELRTLREQNIDGALALITMRNVISEALGYIGSMRLENELGRLTPKQVDVMLFTLSRDLRKAVEA